MLRPTVERHPQGCWNCSVDVGMACMVPVDEGLSELVQAHLYGPLALFDSLCIDIFTGYQVCGKDKNVLYDVLPLLSFIEHAGSAVTTSQKGAVRQWVRFDGLLALLFSNFVNRLYDLELFFHQIASPYSSIPWYLSGR